MYGGNVNEVDEEHGTLLHTLTECNGYSNSVDYPYNVMEYFLKKGKFFLKLVLLTIGGSKGGRQGRAPPLGVQILSFSCSFQPKIEK